MPIITVSLVSQKLQFWFFYFIYFLSLQIYYKKNYYQTFITQKIYTQIQPKL